MTKYELHVLTVSEGTVVHALSDIREAEELIPLFGQRFSEVTKIQLIATQDGKEDVVLDSSSFGEDA